MTGAVHLKCVLIAMGLAAAASPAAAGYPGSTQPGATPVLPGNLLILRQVPPRNAIVPGAGDAVSAPVAPPSAIFSNVTGVGSPLSDLEAASITGNLSTVQAGAHARSAIDAVLQPNSLIGGSSSERGTGSGSGAMIGDAVQSGLGSLRDALSNIGGDGG